MKEQIEAQATAQAVNMLHQIYILEQMNVCRGYNGSSTVRSVEFYWHKFQ